LTSLLLRGDRTHARTHARTHTTGRDGTEGRQPKGGRPRIGGGRWERETRGVER